MINIGVYNYNSVQIESTYYHLNNQHDMVEFLKDLLNKVFYAGETVCLESVVIDTINGKNIYTEIERFK